MLVDNSREVAVCQYCRCEINIAQAVNKVKIDGIATFDSLLIGAQRSIEYDEDFDAAAKKYKEALDIKPDDYRVLWGLFTCEIAAIKWSVRRKGYVKVPGDTPQCVDRAIRVYGERAASVAPQDVKERYAEEIENVKASFFGNGNSSDGSSRNNTQKKGCYVATAVYGSYDCPQVWVLRRYRDERLSKSFFGRCFIKVYYAVSPTVVKLFGKRKAFNSFWKARLDKKVSRLKEKGFSDTPYRD